MWLISVLLCILSPLHPLSPLLHFFLSSPLSLPLPSLSLLSPLLPSPPLPSPPLSSPPLSSLLFLPLLSVYV